MSSAQKRRRRNAKKKLIEEKEFLFLFRLAFTLKKSVVEVLALPTWERLAWKSVFDLFGPLDWKRGDALFARINQFQALSGDPLGEFFLFKDPSDAPTREEKERALLARLGYVEE